MTVTFTFKNTAPSASGLYFMYPLAALISLTTFIGFTLKITFPTVSSSPILIFLISSVSGVSFFAVAETGFFSLFVVFYLLSPNNAPTTTNNLSKKLIIIKKA